jgi:hypothetical protein
LFSKYIDDAWQEQIETEIMVGRLWSIIFLKDHNFEANMSSFTTPNQETMHKGAVALNNIAVSLLQRHYYQEAVETLKDALALMKAVVDYNPGKDSSSAPDVYQILQKSSQRLAYSYHGRSQSLNVFVLSNQEDPVVVHDMIIKHPNSQLCITIDPIDFQQWDQDTFDLDTNVILYNYGVSYTCFAATIRDSKAQSRVLCQSLQIFRLKESFLFEFCDNPSGETLVNRTTLLVNMLLTRNLIQVSHHLDLPGSEVYRVVFVELIEVLQEQVQFTEGIQAAAGA